MRKKVYEKDLLKLNNGYILELKEKDKPPYNPERIFFSVFFNKFDDSYILQSVRAYLSIRRDKEKDHLEPYVRGIRCNGVSKEDLFSSCLETFVGLLEKDNLNENLFGKKIGEDAIRKRLLGEKEIKINMDIQDYFYRVMHTWITNPIFNEYINDYS